MDIDPCKLEVRIDGVEEDTRSEFYRMKTGKDYMAVCDVYAYMRVRIPGTRRDGNVFMRKVLIEAIGDLEIPKDDLDEEWRRDHKNVPKSWFIGAAKQVLSRPETSCDFINNACLELLLEMLEKP